MKTTALLVLGCAMLAALPARADVFSSQGFTGETTTLNNLPGVNLDATPGFGGGAGNCTETEMPSYASRDRYGNTVRGTTCRLGNFSITTMGGGSGRTSLDTTYGGNPPPWQQGWRP